MRLSGKVLIITGGANEFGAGLARTAVGKGAKVVLGDVDSRSGKEVEEELNNERPNSAIYVECDVRNANDLRELFDVAEGRFGGINVVCNSAGACPPGEFPNNKIIETWKTTIDINITSVIEGTQLATQYLKRQGGGVIINIVSTAEVPDSRPSIYSGATNAAITFSKALHHLRDESNIRVNAIAPPCPGKNLSKAGRMSFSRKNTSRLASNGFTIEDVVNTMMHCIENDSLAGELITIAPSRTKSAKKTPLKDALVAAWGAVKTRLRKNKDASLKARR